MSTVLSTKNESCRCGRNVKKGTKRNYRNTGRCNCILKHRSCNQNCKCVGHCGGIACRKKVFGSVAKTRNGPSPEKAKHILQTSMRKSPLSHSENLTISGHSFNFLEICVLCAIIHGFQDMSVDCWDTDRVYSTHISIIEALLDLGIILPIFVHSKQAIERELHTLRKQFHDDS